MPINTLDILCVGHASFDVILSVDKHPNADEKTVADNLLECGGGPAANAAVIASRLGCRSAFAGYLGNDFYGERHRQELFDAEVDVRYVIRGASPTPLSVILVKPNGQRSLVNYKGQTTAVNKNAVDFSEVKPKVVLLDGHEPHLSLDLLSLSEKTGFISILDAGSLHEGTVLLLDKVDYLICSEKFSRQYAGDPESALNALADKAPYVVITLGEYGVIWKTPEASGKLPALPVNAVDTTGAGDAYHGAFAAALVKQLQWRDMLIYAGAAGSYCCTKMGARAGLASSQELQPFISDYRHHLNAITSSI